MSSTARKREASISNFVNADSADTYGIGSYRQNREIGGKAVDRNFLRYSAQKERKGLRFL